MAKKPLPDITGNYIIDVATGNTDTPTAANFSICRCIYLHFLMESKIISLFLFVCSFVCLLETYYLKIMQIKSTLRVVLWFLCYITYYIYIHGTLLWNQKCSVSLWCNISYLMLLIRNLLLCLHLETNSVCPFNNFFGSDLTIVIFPLNI